MKERFVGKALVRPGGRAEVLEWSGEGALEVAQSEDALLACLEGEVGVSRWGKGFRLEAGEVVRLRPGSYALKGQGRLFLVRFGLSPEALSGDHEALMALLEALPAKEAAEALARLFEAHAAKEEALFYPLLSPGTARERALEHKLLRELIGELLKAVKEGRETTGIVARLKGALEAHMEAELG